MGGLSRKRKDLGRRLLEKIYDYKASEWRPELWQRVVIFIPESIGDALAVSPILYALMQKKMKWIGIVTSHRASPVFDGVMQEKNIEIFSVSSDRDYRQLRLIARNIKTSVGGVDCCFDGSVGTSASIYFIATLRAKNNIQKKPPRMKAYNNVVPRWLIDSFGVTPTPIWWASVLKELNIAMVDSNYGVIIPQDTLQRVGKWARELGDYIVLNLDGAVRERQLGAQIAVKLIGGIRSITQLPIVIVYSSEGREKAFDVVGRASGTLVYPKQASILDTAALVKFSRIIISPDTSVVHLASAFNKPTLGLYVKEEDGKKWWPLAAVREVQYCGETLEGCEKYLGSIFEKIKKIHMHLLEDIGVR
jgi:hypothetical protein